MPRLPVALSLLTVACQAFPAAQAVALPSGGGATDGRIGIQLLDAPVNRRADPRARVYIVDHLNPGAVIHRRVQVLNETARAQRFEIYPGAAHIDRGRFVVGADRARNELTGWITVDRASTDVPAGATGTATVSIRVPRQASRGERYGVVWAQVTAKPDAQHSVGQASRVGVRIYLDVGPGGEPRSDFSVDTLTALRTDEGVPELGARVHNTGERALDLTGSVMLRDGPGGVNAGPFRVRPGSTPAPDETVQIVVPLSRDLPAGPWTATLTLRSGLVEHSVRTRFTFPAAGEKKLASTAWPPAWGVTALSVGVLLLAAFLAFRWYRRRHASG